MGAMAVVLMAGVSVKTFAAENLLNQIKERGTLRVASKAPTLPLVSRGMTAS
ncbi:cystine ABC transporter [Klebsiella pneumoniae]|uniref:Cystine ABC transporter n=1 Tax=Klebsiella pneumoniae TaxID=573 RepID=A0A2X3F744_KLEPN|nr:cystine ABC transporter [Klebsiella pneumoniae]